MRPITLVQGGQGWLAVNHVPNQYGGVNVNRCTMAPGNNAGTLIWSLSALKDCVLSAHSSSCNNTCTVTSRHESTQPFPTSWYQQRHVRRSIHMMRQPHTATVHLCVPAQPTSITNDATHSITLLLTLSPLHPRLSSTRCCQQHATHAQHHPCLVTISFY